VADILGTHEYQMDPKGRISLPADLRDAFEDGVFLTLGQEGCLYAYPRDEWERKKAELREYDSSDPNSRAYIRMFTAHAAVADLDSQGRLVIPRKLRERTGLHKEVAVVGALTHAEIWAGDAWERYEATHGSSYAAGSLAPGKS
jgi:MraZ protein